MLSAPRNTEGEISPVVANPTEQHRSNPLGDLVQGKIAAMMQPPATYPLTHRFGRFLAHGGRKTHEEFSLAVLQRPGSKRIRPGPGRCRWLVVLTNHYTIASFLFCTVERIIGAPNKFLSVSDYFADTCDTDAHSHANYCLLVGFTGQYHLIFFNMLA